MGAVSGAMFEGLGPILTDIQAMLADTVETPCGVADGKGLPCGLPADHSGKPRHCRLAVPGEAAYLEGKGNSIITWTAGPEVRRIHG